MGIRDVLTNFLSSEGTQDRGGRDDGSTSGDTADSADAQGGSDDSVPSETGFDVELEELDQEEQVEALEGRLEDLEGNIEQQDSELETIKGSQQDVAEQLNEVNDTVRQLLGIYDQLTAQVNPFMDGPTRDADPDADGFGVVGGEEPDPEGDVVEAVVDGDADDADDADEDADDDEATTIGLDDIREEATMAADEADEADEAATQRTADAAEAAVVQDDEPADNEIEVEPTTNEGEMSQHDVRNERRDEQRSWREDDASTPSQSTAILDELADTYASEIIVFEWLTSLVSTGGPAATLRAIAYYEDIGWIDHGVKAYLEDVLSGPDLDMNVDPSREPNELTAEDHAESYEYIMKLDAVQRTIEDTGL